MIANHEVTLVQQYAVVGLVSIPLFLLAGAGTIYITPVLELKFFLVIWYISL